MGDGNKISVVANKEEAQYVFLILSFILTSLVFLLGASYLVDPGPNAEAGESMP